MSIARSTMMVVLVASAPAAPAAAKLDQRGIGQMTAECTVEQSRAQVRALLATLPGSAVEARVARRLNAQFDACGGGQMRLTAGRAGSGLYNGRADLAAAMVTAAPETALPKPGAEVWYAKAAATAGQGGFDPVLLGFQEFGSCVAAAAPEAAARLVRADAGSDEEQAAITALRPVLGGCVAKDGNVTFSRAALRLMVAEPVYHALEKGA